MPSLAERKLRKTGTSLSVSMPADWLRFQGIGPGDIVDVLYNQIVLVKPHDMKLDKRLLEEFLLQIERKRGERLKKLENHEARLR